MHAATDNGLQIALTSDPNDRLSPEEIYRGVKLIRLDPPTYGDTSGMSHFFLLDEQGQKVTLGSSASSSVAHQRDMNCGYEIIGALCNPPKYWLTVLTETAESILDNPGKFENIVQMVRWLQDRHPEPAKQFTFQFTLEPKTSGKRKVKKVRKSKEVTEVTTNPLKVFNMDSELVRKAVEKGPRKSEQTKPGVKLFAAQVEGIGHLMISKAIKNVDHRISELMENNDRQVDAVIGTSMDDFQVNTPAPYWAESIVHLHLDSKGLRRPHYDIDDGKTDFFEISPENARPLVYQAAAFIRLQYSSQFPSQYDQWLDNQTPDYRSWLQEQDNLS